MLRCLSINNKSMRNKITVKDLKNFKGKKQLTLILVKNKEEAISSRSGRYRNDWNWSCW